jgi:hypothetical protein
MSLALGCYQFIIDILNSIAVCVLLGMRSEFFDPYIKKCKNDVLLTSMLGKKNSFTPLQPPRRKPMLYLGGMDWIHVAQDMDQWKAVTNMAVNFQVP